MDIETAESVVAKEREDKKRLEEAREVVSRERRRHDAEQAKTRARAEAEREEAARSDVADWLGEFVARMEELQAKHGNEFVRLLETPAVGTIFDGREGRLPLRLAVDGIAHAVGVLRRQG